jgi:hypothetical protein
MPGIYLKQKVNSYLCIALICLMTFWVVLYYFTHKAFAIADNFSSTANVQDADWGNTSPSQSQQNKPGLKTTHK